MNRRSISVRVGVALPAAQYAMSKVSLEATESLAEDQDRDKMIESLYGDLEATALTLVERLSRKVRGILRNQQD